MKRFQWISLGLLAACVVALAIVSGRERKARQEAERYKQNTAALMTDIRRYKTSDSLNAVQVQSLSLTLDEFKRLRAADMAQIKTLQAKNRSLESITKQQSEALYEMSARPKDTIIIRDTIKKQAKVVRCGDDWYEFQGVVTDDSFEGKMAARDSIFIVETVKYKRFLGFLWRTGIKSRQIDLTNANPHTIVTGFEHIQINK